MAIITAIPTEYNGVSYRSRLEADTARLLTMLRIPFEYEAVSYLLPSGIHYRPDFLLHGRRQVLEVRGYDNDHGNRQVREFAQFVAAHGLGSSECFFGVLSPHPIVESVAAARYFDSHGAHFSTEWEFACAGDPACDTWAMAHGPLQPYPHDALRYANENQWRAIDPAVVDGKLCVKVWQLDPPHECEMRPVRDITEISDLLAY